MGARHAIQGGDERQSRPAGDTTDFGFRRVARGEKAGMVRAVFDSVAPRYDLMNDLMSLGVHRVWKRIFVTDAGSAAARHAARPGRRHRRYQLRLAGEGRRPGAAVGHQRLDAGGGAGPRAGARRGGRRCRCWSPTPSACRCRIARWSGCRSPSGCATAPTRTAVLREARRVLKPGGRFFCLEFSRVQVAALQPLYDAWSFRVLPRLGRVVAKDADSYQYLAESIRTFPDQATLAGDDAGGRVRAGQRAQSVGRDRGDPSRVAAMNGVHLSRCAGEVETRSGEGEGHAARASMRLAPHPALRADARPRAAGEA